MTITRLTLFVYVFLFLLADAQAQEPAFYADGPLAGFKPAIRYEQAKGGICALPPTSIKALHATECW